MTSEILLMNRNAIVLASDSLVTLNSKKTYEGANKIFKLSNNPPMGVMIYGNGNFGDIPLETLINDYSDKTDFNKLDNILDIKDDFLEYLGRVTPKTDFKNIIEENIQVFHQSVGSKINQMSRANFEDFINFCSNIELPSFLEDFDEINNYDDIFKSIIPYYVESDDFKKVIYSLKRCFLEDLLSVNTGIIIAGFNKSDFFPSYVSFQLCFNINGKIAIKNFDSKINREKEVILPFAQCDVIESFLTGIDEKFKSILIDYILYFFKEHDDKLKGLINDIPDINHDNLLLIIDEIDNLENRDYDGVMKNFKEYVDNLQNLFKIPVFQSVNVLPKEELADMAESLINITSLKSKLDENLTSVGGDIDVAVISKGDGFIWRKHNPYFDIKLNAQYLDDKF